MGLDRRKYRLSGLIFSDAASKYWHWDRYGSLTEIREVPPSVERHFFQSGGDKLN